MLKNFSIKMDFKSVFHINPDKKRRTKKLNWYYAPLFIAFWLMMYAIAVTITLNFLPTPIKITDEGTKTNGRFIAQNAERTLMELIKLGPRIVGSKINEYDTVNFLLRKINEIHSNANNQFKFEIDVQIVSGSYVHWDMINMYQGVQNVIVKLSAKNSKSSNYLLINSHYDSAIGSPGAGDDGTMVAVMLEVMRVISQQSNDRSIEHPIVFLFNGAEENPLQASHGFVTQHKWAKNCKALINLDSAGNGGREVLFQSGPQNGWLIKKYCKNAPHPLATTIAEELFQNNFIPSDTDFRIFRDYGGIPGLDMAHTYNGYVYHTEHDRSSIVPRGTFQNTGDNVLELARSIANAPEMYNTTAHKDGHVIFFDFLGLYMIFYSETAGIFINIMISVIAIVTIYISLLIISSRSELPWTRVVQRFAITFILQILSLTLGYGIALLIGLFMDSIDRSMSWFSENWLIFGLYYCPIFFGMGIIPALYLQRTKEDSLDLVDRIQLFLHSHCLFLVLLTLSLTAAGIRSSYATMIAVLFYTLAMIGTNFLIKSNRKAHNLILIVAASQILPFIYYSYIFCVGFYTLIPMQGRSGHSMNPDISIASLAFITSILLAGFIIPILMFFRNTKRIISSFMIVGIAIISISLTPIGFPYTEKVAVQRISIIHSRRILHNFDGSVRINESGAYIYPQDRHLHSVDAFISNGIENVKRIGSICDSEMLCGLPHFNHRWNKAKESSFWIPFEEEPIVPGIEPKLNLLKKTKNSSLPSLIRFEFELTGPDHTTIFIGIKGEAKIKNWSFNETMLQKMKPPYFIYFSYGKDNSSLKFFIEIEKFDQKTDQNSFNSASLEIGIGGHWVHHNNFVRTNQYEKIVSSFPNWAYVNDWVATYESWIY